MSASPAPIGLDLDNTIVDYSELLVAASGEVGPIDPTVGRGKHALRYAIRALPDGEMKWQLLQSIVYGKRMAEARLIDGVVQFLGECRRRAIPIRIVSHKTRYAAADPGGIDLRDAALNWLMASGIFEIGGMTAEDVFFEESRSEKVNRIGWLGCSHFIDDLEEVFLETGFPTRTIGILFDPHGVYTDGQLGVVVCRSWQEIANHVFASGH